MSANASSTAELIASYIGALGTVSAVVLALFLQVFLVNRRRPRLHVTLSNEIDDEDIVLLELDRSFAYFLRVKVWAQPKRKAANRVQGLLLSVTRPKEAGDTTTRKVPDGAFKWSGSALIDEVNIAPGTWRRLDILCYAQQRDWESPILAPALNRPTMTTHWPPSMRSRLTDAGDYAIDFVISCDEAIPTFWRLTFRLEPGGALKAADLASHVKNPKIERLR